MDKITVREGQPINVDVDTAQAIRRRLIALKAELQPTIDFLAGGEAQPVVQNLIGSVQVTPTLVLDVEPKTEPGQDWTAAVFDLLVSEKVNFEAYTKEAEKASRHVLPDAFARLYADQLAAAVRREGPLAVMVQVRTAPSRLSGRLDVTRWVTSNFLRPQVFPQQETVLTVDNPYTSAMAWVAEALAVRCSDPRIASRLRSVARTLRPGLRTHTNVDPGIALRDVPPQWRAYRPAWITTCAVLARISPIHRSGFLEGLGLAVEPWPLLETLLHRSLHAAARQGEGEGLQLTARGHSTHRLLDVRKGKVKSVPLDRIHRSRAVEPDGSLSLNGELIATFEAKYARPTGPESIRTHIFQAMSTAAAVGSPLSVLVYPERSEPVVWGVHGFDHKPDRVVALGLDMFGYRRGKGDAVRGRLFLDLVRQQALILSRNGVDPIVPYARGDSEESVS